MCRTACRNGSSIFKLPTKFRDKYARYFMKFLGVYEKKEEIKNSTIIKNIVYGCTASYEFKYRESKVSWRPEDFLEPWKNDNSCQRSSCRLCVSSAIL